jgi:hypothetical protein
LIDNKSDSGLEADYRITIYLIKEINMNRLTQNSLAAFAAMFLTLTSIGTIVTVPPAQAAAPVALTLPTIA